MTRDLHGVTLKPKAIPTVDAQGLDVVLLDNYDSFTHNLYQYLSLTGAPVSVYRTREITVEDVASKHPAITHLVVSPGPGHPLHDSGCSIDAIKYFAGRIPILGVCMGLQCIFAAYGGYVDAAGEVIHGKTSTMMHDSKGLFFKIPQGIRATRYHSLAGGIDSLPACLEVTSRTQEGVPGEKGGIIMGVRHRDFTIEAVQYHPESILSEYGQEMLANFLALRGGKWIENPTFGVAASSSSPPTSSSRTNKLPTILETIAKQRLADIEQAKATPGFAQHDLDSLISLHVPPPIVSFHQRLSPGKAGPLAQHVALMGEVKRASPSQGNILPPQSTLSAPQIALDYALAGASVISVLTEPKWFKGSLEDLRAVRSALDTLPHRPAILRKDFILDTYQIDEARIYGADTVLLIVAMLDDTQLRTLFDHARMRGMEPLVEVNNQSEMDRALALGATVIGVNNRNLHDFEVDMQTTSRLVDALKAHAKGDQHVILCALSGITSRQDVERYVSQGVGAVLVGTALMLADDKPAFVRSLLGSARSTDTRPDSHTKLRQPPLVKICGIKTPEMALAAAEAGADLIGLMFVSKSKRFVDKQAARNIIAAVRNRSHPVTNGVNGTTTQADAEDNLDWFALQALRVTRYPKKPLFVGVFQNNPLEEVLDTVDSLGLDLVQLHGTEPAGWARVMPVPVVRAFHVRPSPSSSSGIDESALIDVARPGYHALPLLDAALAGNSLSGGAGKAFDWSVANRIVRSRQSQGLPPLPIILAGGLDPSNVARAVEQVEPFALDVSGGVETAGEKDEHKIRAFIGAAKGDIS